VLLSDEIKIHSIWSTVKHSEVGREAKSFNCPVRRRTKRMQPNPGAMNHPKHWEEHDEGYTCKGHGCKPVELGCLSTDRRKQIMAIKAEKSYMEQYAEMVEQEKEQAKYPHLIVCNCDHRMPIGSPSCICKVVNVNEEKEFEKAYKNIDHPAVHALIQFLIENNYRDAITIWDMARQKYK
jgi:hypothetical protein